MLSNIVWGIFLILFVLLMVFIDKRKQNRKGYKPYREKTEQEKEIEKQIAIEKERSRWQGPPGGPGGIA